MQAQHFDIMPFSSLNKRLPSETRVIVMPLLFFSGFTTSPFLSPGRELSPSFFRLCRPMPRLVTKMIDELPVGPVKTGFSGAAGNRMVNTFKIDFMLVLLTAVTACSCLRYTKLECAVSGDIFFEPYLLGLPTLLSTPMPWAMPSASSHRRLLCINARTIACKLKDHENWFFNRRDEFIVSTIKNQLY